MHYRTILALSSLLLLGCSIKKTPNISTSHNTSIIPSHPYSNEIVYFLLTDRFHNAQTHNDFVHPQNPAPLRGFYGGDLEGITERINEGYFSDLGVSSIWMTPIMQNIDGAVDEGTGLSYGFHGYWIKDWTAIDPRIGNKQDLKNLVKSAHDRDIKVILDVVINHTGPVTTTDTQWPLDWVRTKPRCTYNDYNSTVSCTLVDNLPDIKTESTIEVELPAHLIDKWKKEGRYAQEIESLNQFFKETKYPKLPIYYIIKWLTDYIRTYGVDGFRVDTAKHVEEEVWRALRLEADKAYADYLKSHPNDNRQNRTFFMVGEVYNYSIDHERLFDFGDKKVDYFAYGFDALINFGFKYDAHKSYAELFDKYTSVLSGPLKEKTVMNYISSHDDGTPFDKYREKNYEAANKLLLTPGMVQIYYGDEIGRTLTADAEGDAQLRSPFMWEERENPEIKLLMSHYQKLGQFRRKHPAISFGTLQVLSPSKNIFTRTCYTSEKGMDKILIALDQNNGPKVIPVGQAFEDGTQVLDFYSGTQTIVKNKEIHLDTPYDIVLIESIH